MKKYEYSFHALGTFCQLIVVSDISPENSFVNKIHKNIKDFENEFSRFLSSSSLMQLNTHKKLEVSDRFLKLLFYSQELFSFTHGYFNPLVDVRRIGYSESFEKNDFETFKNEMFNNDFSQVKNYGNLVELKDGMFLDFGSIAKGFLADEISEIFYKHGYGNHLINFGGDIKAMGKNLEGKNWHIAISSPFKEEFIESVDISNKSISTSGVYLRNWEISGEKFHHIITPFGPQTTDLVSVSIIDFYGYKTDGLATAVLAMGKQKAIDFCEKNNIKYVFVDSEGNILKN